MDGKMDEATFEEFAKRMNEKLDSVSEERDLRAFTLPNVLGDPDYIRYLTMEYNFTDRVN